MAIDAKHATPRMELLGAFMEFLNTREHYIGTSVYPISTVPDIKAFYPAVTRESLTDMPENMQRAPDGTYAAIKFNTVDKEYNCKEYGLELPLDDLQTLSLSRTYNLPVEMIATQVLTFIALRNHENAVAAQVIDPVTNFPANNSKNNYSDVSGTNPWSDPDSDIVSTIRAAQEAVADMVGTIPRYMVCNYSTYSMMLSSREIKGRLKMTEDNTPARMGSVLAPMVGLEKIYVGMSVYNATPGYGAYATAKCWPDHYVNVFVGDESAAFFGPRLGTTCLYAPDSPDLITLEEYYENKPRSRIFRTRSVWQALTLDTSFGHLMKVSA